VLQPNDIYPLFENNDEVKCKRRIQQPDGVRTPWLEVNHLQVGKTVSVTLDGIKDGATVQLQIVKDQRVIRSSDFTVPKRMLALNEEKTANE
jgi:hypothetical protein